MSVRSKVAHYEDVSFTPKRGRPNKAQVAAIERSILGMARQLFLSDGYANTAMDAIATAAGVSKGTLYSRYPDKPSLFKAIVSEMLARSPALTSDAIIFGKGSAAEQLYRFGTFYVGRLLTPEAIAFGRLIDAEADKFPELALEFKEQGYSRATQRLAARIESSCRADGWPASDPQAVATAYISGLTGWVQQERRARNLSKEDCDAFVGRFVGLIVGGRSVW